MRSVSSGWREIFTAAHVGFNEKDLWSIEVLENLDGASQLKAVARDFLTTTQESGSVSGRSFPGWGPQDLYPKS